MTDSNHIRSLVFNDLGKHYGSEVPLYNKHLEIIKASNKRADKKNPESLLQLGLTPQRLTEERHGAIRVGTPYELKTFASIFKIMGMYPVNYYELTVEGHPIHSTAFRPITKQALAKNPSRMFCSMLRSDLLPYEIREDVVEYLNSRKVFSDILLELIYQHKKERGFKSDKQAKQFSREVVKTLTWKGKVDVPAELFRKVKQFSDIAADILSGPNINHLTPVAIDIEDVFQQMQKAGMITIDTIQGPPSWIKVFLNQTSFKAVARPLRLKKSDGSDFETTHKTQFGEVESRYLSLKPEGRALYQQCFDNAMKQITELMKFISENIDKNSMLPAAYNNLYRKLYPIILDNAFIKFPTDYQVPGSKAIGYFEYNATSKGLKNKVKARKMDLDDLLNEGYVAATKIIYEDFLPASAARIFDSNLENQLGKLSLNFKNLSDYKKYEANQKMEFERALGEKVIMADKLYSEQEAASIKLALKQLGLKNNAN